MKKLLAVALFSILALSAADAFAYDGCKNNNYGINRRQSNQNQRIWNGGRQGALTRQEMNRLADGQRRIQIAENRYRADGRLTSSEYARLDKMQDKQNRLIQELKTNRQVRNY